LGIARRDKPLYVYRMKKTLLLAGLLQLITLLSYSQNVGIGVTNPEQPLSVKGGMVIDQTNLNSGTPANTLRFGSFSGEAIGSSRVSGPNQYALDFYTQNLHRMTISNGGNVGIGLINPSAKLEIRGALGFSSTTKRWEMNYDSTANYFYIDEFGAGRRFYIANGGNVGIGTATPAAKLDVNGDLNVETRILLNKSPGSAGQVIMSAGSGNAQWKNMAFGNSDRFLFISSSNLITSSTAFSDTIKYDVIYAKSSAISYNNGVFTIHKSGLYQFDATFFAIANSTSGAFDAGAYAYLLANSVVNFVSAKIGYTGFTGGLHRCNDTYPTNITLYFDAGSTFIFYGGIYTSAALHSSGFSLCPLSINLISE
jgi:hypothetical protein